MKTLAELFPEANLPDLARKVILNGHLAPKDYLEPQVLLEAIDKGQLPFNAYEGALSVYHLACLVREERDAYQIIVRAQLKSTMTRLHSSWGNGNAPLGHLAVARGFVNVFNQIIHQGFVGDLTYRIPLATVVDHCGNTLLMIAAKHRRYAVIEPYIGQLDYTHFMLLRSKKYSDVESLAISHSDPRFLPLAFDRGVAQVTPPNQVRQRYPDYSDFTFRKNTYGVLDILDQGEATELSRDVMNVISSAQEARKKHPQGELEIRLEPTVVKRHEIHDEYLALTEDGTLVFSERVNALTTLLKNPSLSAQTLFNTANDHQQDFLMMLDNSIFDEQVTEQQLRDLLTAFSAKLTALNASSTLKARLFEQAFDLINPMIGAILAELWLDELQEIYLKAYEDEPNRLARNSKYFNWLRMKVTPAKKMVVDAIVTDQVLRKALLIKLCGDSDLLIQYELTLVFSDLIVIRDYVAPQIFKQIVAFWCQQQLDLKSGVTLYNLLMEAIEAREFSIASIIMAFDRAHNPEAGATVCTPGSDDTINQVPYAAICDTFASLDLSSDDDWEQALTMFTGAFEYFSLHAPANVFAWFDSKGHSLVASMIERVYRQHGSDAVAMLLNSVEYFLSLPDATPSLTNMRLVASYCLAELIDICVKIETTDKCWTRLSTCCQRLLVSDRAGLQSQAIALLQRAMLLDVNEREEYPASQLILIQTLLDIIDGPIIADKDYVKPSDALVTAPTDSSTYAYYGFTFMTCLIHAPALPQEILQSIVAKLEVTDITLNAEYEVIKALIGDGFDIELPPSLTNLPPLVQFILTELPNISLLNALYRQCPAIQVCFDRNSVEVIEATLSERCELADEIKRELKELKDSVEEVEREKEKQEEVRQQQLEAQQKEARQAEIRTAVVEATAPMASDIAALKAQVTELTQLTKELMRALSEKGNASANAASAGDRNSPTPTFF